MAKISKRAVPKQLPLAIAMSEGFSQLVQLSEECQESFDNMPESLQNGDYAQGLQEVADALSYLEEPDVPQWLVDQDDVVSFTENQRANLTRDDRRANAIAVLEAVRDKLEDKVEELRADGTPDDDNDRIGELEQLIDDLVGQIDEAEAVDFPRR